MTQTFDIPEIAQQLDASSRMDWFNTLIDNDLSQTGIVEIIASHAAKTKDYPLTADRVSKAALPPNGSPKRLFGIVGSIAGTSPGWPDLRDSMATRMSEIAVLHENGEDFRIKPVVQQAPPRHPGKPGQKGVPQRAPEPEMDPDEARADRLAREAKKANASAVRKVDLSLQPIPAILPPPPPKDFERSAMLAWLSGRPWHPTAMGLVIPAGAIDMDDMMDLERDVSSNAAAILARPDVRQSVDMKKSDHCAAILNQMPAKIGGQDMPLDRADMALCAVAQDVMAKFSPDQSAAMKRLGVTFQAGSEAKALAAAALSVERFWLDTDPEGEGGEPDLRGFPSDSASLKSGFVLKRAMFLHLVTSMPVAEALMEGLIELRAHQAFKAYGFTEAISLTNCEKMVYEFPQGDLSYYRQPEPDLEMAP